MPIILNYCFLRKKHDYMKNLPYLYYIFFLLFVVSACKDDQPIDPTDLAINWDSLTFDPQIHDLTIPPTLPAQTFRNPPENALTEEGIQLGRMLFYDPILSLDSTLACAGCHNQQLAFTDDNKKFSEGVNGAMGNRNSMALFNLGWMNGFFWNGSATTLERQAREPVPNPKEMHLPWQEAIKRLMRQRDYRIRFYEAFGAQEITQNLVTKALAQFERTLISGSSVYDLHVTPGTFVYMSEEAQWGMELFHDENKGDCFHCHGRQTTGNLFTDNLFHNNGLQDAETIDDFAHKGLGDVTGRPQDFGRFKTPSLRNVALTAPYMHDGRFATLEEVLNHYTHDVKLSPNLDINLEIKHKQGGLDLNEEEKQAIIAFLEALTDTTFLGNPDFASPF